MPFVYRLCLCLLVVPALAGAEPSREEVRESVDQFDCLVNPSISGLVSCLPTRDDTALGYRWDMGDGTVYTNNEQEPHVYHTYKEPGDYTVTLTINRAKAVTTSRNVLSIPELREEATASQLARGHFP